MKASGGDGCSTASGGMVENGITDRAYRDDLIAAFGPYAYRRTARDVGQTNLMLTTEAETHHICVVCQGAPGARIRVFQHSRSNSQKQAGQRVVVIELFLCDASSDSPRAATQEDPR